MNQRIRQAVESLITAKRAYRGGFPFPTRGDLAAVILAMIRAEDELMNALNEEADFGRSEP